MIFTPDNNFTYGTTWVEEPYTNVGGHWEWENEVGCRTEWTTQDIETQ
jgi:hypothetical protein